MSKKEKKPAPKEVKKVEEKPKLNYEELILKNLAEPKLSIDHTGYHFTFLNLRGKSLDSLSAIFGNYKALSKIDLQKNNIQDVTVLGNLPNLLWLDASQNNIKDMKAFQNEEGFRSLKYLNLSKNRINELLTPKVPNLLHLNLNENLIDKMETFEGHENLKTLELVGNKLITTQQLVNMPKLEELYLANNKIKTVAGIDSLVSLTTLHLRQNNIEVFEETFPALNTLKYLNLRENKIEKFEEIMKLAPLEKIETLIYSFNPLISKNPNYLLETINLILKLKRVNKVKIDKSVKMDAYNYAEKKHKIAEEEKLRLEEEERAKEMQEQQEEN